MCTELLEHVQQWRSCLKTARNALRPGGALVVTCVSDGRPPDGTRGGALPEPGEWYDNVYANELRDTLGSLFAEYEVTFNPDPGDVYAWARA
ncbi:MAG: hypothetical protein JO272_04655 [Pseudonocardiales bacterium]|nr:hypothetical protein [Pseudonocardiales bacterium]